MAKTDFQRGGAQDLVEYMSRDNDEKVALKDHTGRELEPEQITAFVERSEEHGMERHLILSPDPDAAYNEQELDRGTRRTMSAFRSDDRLATEYVYAIHADHENPHAHVAMTGPEQDLGMDKHDITYLREIAREQFQEPTMLQARAPEKAAGRETLAESEQEREQRALQIALDPEQQSQREQTPQRDHTGTTSSTDREQHPDRDRGHDRSRGGR
ncbi:relaxase/mobilization nuclease domain-containing protein [Halorientalis brevis]